MYRRQFLKAAIGSSVAVAAGQVSGIAPLFGSAAAQNGDQQRTVQVDRLNLRSGPGLGYDVVTVLSYGDVVSIAGGTQWADGYEWVEVAVYGSQAHGWVAAEYIGTNAGDWGSATPGATRIVNTDVLNLRLGPGLSHDVITGLAYGTEVVATGNSLLADGYDWWEVDVESRGLTGWVASELLASGPGTGPAGSPKDRVQVADGPLHVRSEPGLDGEVYYSAPSGAYGTVMDPDFVEADGYTWVYVQLDDNAVIGWMALAYLSYIDVA